MTRPTTLKLVLFVVGLFLFASGIRAQRPEVRWAGIALIAVAFFMRLLPKERPPGDGPSERAP